MILNHLLLLLLLCAEIQVEIGINVENEAGLVFNDVIETFFGTKTEGLTT